MEITINFSLNSTLLKILFKLLMFEVIRSDAFAHLHEYTVYFILD